MVRIGGCCRDVMLFDKVVQEQASYARRRYLTGYVQPDKKSALKLVTLERPSCLLGRTNMPASVPLYIGRLAR